MTNVDAEYAAMEFLQVTNVDAEYAAMELL